MGKCQYCGEPAGFLRRQHHKCRELHDLAEQKIPAFFTQFLKSTVPADKFRQLASDVARTHFVDEIELHRLAIQNIARLVDTTLQDHLLTADEEARITGLSNEFNMTEQEADESGLRKKVVKAAILRELDDGKTPDRVHVQGLSIVLQKDEKIVWLFQGVQYFTIKNRTQYVGGSQGVSIRIMKGVYYRVGAMKGERVQTPEMKLEDTGELVFTNKNVVFHGSLRSTRIPLKKVVSIDPYSDGVRIIRESANPTPQIFLLDDPWFATNLVSKLGQL